MEVSFLVMRQKIVKNVLVSLRSRICYSWRGGWKRLVDGFIDEKQFRTESEPAREQ